MSGYGMARDLARLKDTVIRSFVKCGISLPISGSRDSEINIDGLLDYHIGNQLIYTQRRWSSSLT